MKVEADIHIHLHDHGDLSDRELSDMLEKLSTSFRQFKEQYTMDQKALADSLDNLATEITKIGTETQSLIDQVATLTTAVAAAGNTTPEVDAALAAVQAQADKVDGMVSDLPELPTA